MKKSSIILTTSILFMLVFIGHVHVSGKTRYGIKGGLNFANLSGDVEDKYLKPASKTTFMFGGFATTEMGKYLCIQPEVYYAMKGAKADDDKLDIELKLTYIEIPVLAKLVIPTPGAITPSIFVGPVADLLLSAEISSGNFDVDIKDNVMKIDAGLVVGAGVDINAGKGKFILDGRYTSGFISVDDTDDEDNIKNGVFSILVGYAF
jgi:hypothetical protein